MATDSGGSETSMSEFVPVYVFTNVSGDPAADLVYYYSMSATTPPSFSAAGVASFRSLREQDPRAVPVYQYIIVMNNPSHTGVYYYSTSATTPPNFIPHGVAFYAYASEQAGAVPVHYFTMAADTQLYYYSSLDDQPPGYIKQGVHFWAAPAPAWNPARYSVVTAESGQVVASFSALQGVDFSGQTNRAPASFTVGGWIRLVTTGKSHVVFQAPNQFELSLDSSGHLTAALLSATPSAPITSDRAIADTEWHYVAASYSALSSSAGVLSVYLDGTPQSGPATPSGSPNQATCTLGTAGQANNLEYASWAVWAAALAQEELEVPLWGPPAPGSELAAELIGAFEFANGGVFSSNPAITVTASMCKSLQPCLAVSEPGFAAITSDTPLAIGNADPWTFSAWAKAPSGLTADDEFGLYIAEGVGDSGEKPSFRISATLGGATPSIAITLVRPPQNPNVLLTAPCDLTRWTHVAVTYDGAQLALFIDGANVAQAGATLPVGMFTSGMVAACSGANGWTGLIQEATLWTEALSATQIAQYMDGSDPDTTGLQATFPLLSDLTDPVLGRTLGVVNGKLHVDEEIVSPNAPPRNAARPVRGSVRAEKGRGSLLTRHDYRRLAAELGIEFRADETDGSHIRARADMAELLASTELPPKLQNDLVDEFQRDWYIAAELRNRGIMTGRIEAMIENDHHVFYYHTLDGPEEIYRTETAVSPMTAWAVTIALDVLAVVLALIGYAASPAAVRNATRGRRLARLFPAIAAAASQVSPTTSGATTLVANVVTILNNAGTLAAIIWNILTFSWLDMIFTGLSIIASILSTACLPAGLAWKLATVWIAIANLAFDLTQKPREVAPPQSTLGIGIPPGGPPPPGLTDPTGIFSPEPELVTPGRPPKPGLFGI